MQIALISTALAIVLLLCFVWAIKTGLRIGLDLAKGKAPNINLSPVKAVTEAIEQHEQRQEEKKAEEELADIMNCSSESMLQAIKKENSKL